VGLNSVDFAEPSPKSHSNASEYWDVLLKVTFTGAGFSRPETEKLAMG
jgi:hypothetical protein